MLDLKGAKLSESLQADILARMFKQNPHLQALSLERSSLNDEDGAKLLHV